MMPRSSRSQSTLVPAESMIASAPHVRCPARLHATIGNVPCSLRRADDGAVVPVQTSNIPPVPNVILARPGRTHPWPTRLPCWSPTSAAKGGDPASALASPKTPVESTTVGSISIGTPSAAQASVDHAVVSARSRPVTAAFDGSVTCTAPPDSTHATQVSTVPKHRSRSRAPAMLFSSQATLVADWLGASASPCSAFAVMQSNTVRRSCQPSPGPIGWPVLRSHTNVEARWLVMPTASTGPAAASDLVATSSTAAAIAAPSNSTSPGNGVDGGNGRYSSACTAPSPSTTAARRPGCADVDDEHAHDEPLLDARLDDG